MKRRSVEVVVMSDFHLGTFGCHAKELLNYLQSINPKTLVLNGDIIDAWQFNKHYFPKNHIAVIKEIMNLASNGTRVIYITGNHDEFLRRYTDTHIGNIYLCDKIVLEINGRKTWIFHGDIFDNTTKGTVKLIAKLGGYGYDLLILFNRLTNFILAFLGKEKISLSKKVKSSVKKAVSWINNFEITASELAIKKGYEYVVCGHIHQAQIRTVNNPEGSTNYLNSGDWVESLTSLEFNDNEWEIYRYNPKDYQQTKPVTMERKIKLPVVESDVIDFFISTVTAP